jgi:isocitrate dehydrogenase (NAD+)
VAHAITLIPGDGIGPEVSAVARRAVDATGLDVEWDVRSAGVVALARDGTLLPRATVDSIAANGVALKGPLTVVPGHGSPNVALRRELDLYCNVRPAVGRASICGQDVDVVVIRMTLEDVTAGIQFGAGEPGNDTLRRLVAETHGIELPDDTGISLKPLTRHQARRLHEAAFAYAERHGRERITTVHKAPNQPATDGVFLEAGREVAEGHPTVGHDDRLVDAVCHDLARDPSSYDVLATTTQYGDIVSDLTAGLTGGLGLAPSANLGSDCAVFEAVHGTAPRLAGRDMANPLALVRAATMLLRRIGEDGAADRIDHATEALLDDGPLTYDLDRTGEPARTSEVGTALERLIESQN